MTIDHNLTEFHGRPVRDYVPGGGLADAGEVAWRLRWEWDGPPFLDGQLHPFLAEPDVALVRALVIGLWSDDYSDHSGELITELASYAHLLPALRALFLGDMTFEECEVSWIHHGDVTALAEAFPALEEYGVRGGSEEITVRPFASASLRKLTFESGGLPVAVVRAVSNSELPSLEHLELWLGTDDYGGDASIADLAPILDGERFPALRRLGLRDSVIADEVAASLAAAPVAGRLEILDLSLGTLGDEGALALLQGQPLAHLSLLDLHHHYLSDHGMAQVRASGLNVDLSDRQTGDGGDRYVAVGE